MRASRNPRQTEGPGRPETNTSPLDQAWKGACGAGAATGGPPWRAEPAPQLAGPSVRKLKVSYVRAGAGRGAPGPGAPSRCAPPARSGRLCNGPGRSMRGRQGGAGGALGLHHSAETRPWDPNPEPQPHTGRGPAGTTSGKSPARDQLRTRAPGSPLLSPVPLPAP